MKFVHPEILWALGALAVPIIVHLFNFRKFKKVLFSNVAFLKEIQVETQSRSRLKHLLILLARLLAMACIILAFAQPYIPVQNAQLKSGDRAVSIYLDNSFSMEGQLSGVALIDVAKNKAIEIAQSYSPTDKFQLLTNDFEGRHQRLVSREEVVELIQEVDISAASRLASEVFSRQRDLLNASGIQNRVAFQLTDLQASVCDYSEIVMDTSIALRIVPTVSDQSNNVFVDSVWFSSAVRQINQPEELHIRLTNSGSGLRENIPVELILNDQKKGVASVTIEAGEQAETTITFTHLTPGFQHASIAIDDYPVSFDDVYYFGYNVLPEIQILSIRGEAESTSAVASVFEDDPYFRFESVGGGQIDFSKFAAHQFIILNQLDRFPTGLTGEIERFVTNGGSVCIVPSEDADFTSYNDLLSRLGLGTITARVGGENLVTAVDYEHPLFKNAFEISRERVDLPAVSIWYVLSPAIRSETSSVMSLRTGSPFLAASHAGSGLAYFSAVPLSPSFSEFTSHAFFPASLLRMAELSQPASVLSYTLGQDQSVELKNTTLAGEETFRLKELKSGLEFIPEHRNAGGNTQLFIRADLKQAGNYSLTKSDSEIGSIAFNYNRLESYTSSLTEEEIKEISQSRGWSNMAVIGADLEHVGILATELDEGKKYWWTMVIWSLIFLAIEILLIKYWK